MSVQLQTTLIELSRKLNSGREAEVLAELRVLQKNNPKNTDVLHLTGLAYKKNGDLANAIASMQESLKLAHNQPQVHNNLANIFKNNAQFDLAERHYRKALDLQSSYVDAWKNLGLFLFEQSRFKEAINVLKQALRLSPQNVSVLTILADVYKEQEKYVSSEKTYLEAIKINPHSLNALHNLGMLYKLNDRLEEALECYENALKLSPENVDINFSYANALFESEKYQESEDTYKLVLQIKNDFIPGHEWLNEFYWQTGKHENFGKSYQNSLEKEPANLNLIYSFANSKYAANQISEVNTILQTYAQNTNDPRILHLRGRMSADEKDYASAEIYFEQAMQSGFSVGLASELIKLYIIKENYAKADALLDKYLEVKPNDQLAWALRSLNWRLQGDERFNWLVNDYDYVKPYVLETPNGYTSVAEYLEELSSVLLEMHNMQNEPLRQTLKLGSQTPGRLLYKRNPVIQTLKDSFTAIVGDYINSLPMDAAHPLLKRNTGDFKFSGSWSVKLNSGGYHVNHVHPEGWLSSSFYVSIPAYVPQDNNAQQGAIKFGESPLQLGERESIAKIITPRPGMLVLFPSYTWHGTIPFESEGGEFRLTAPFDVTPV